MVLGALYLKKSVKNVPFKAMVIFVVRKRWDPNEQRTIRKLSPLWIPCPFKDPSHNSHSYFGVSNRFGEDAILQHRGRTYLYIVWFDYSSPLASFYNLKLCARTHTLSIYILYIYIYILYLVGLYIYNLKYKKKFNFKRV